MMTVAMIISTAAAAVMTVATVVMMARVATPWI